MINIKTDIEERLAAAFPEVDLILAEIVEGTTLRVFIDHPDGVTLQLCERVSKELAPLQEQYAVEVSSPGQERPLTKPAHFQRFIGRPALVRTREPRDGCRNFKGQLVAVTETEVTIAAPTGVVTIPYAAIHRSNLAGE